MARFKEKVKKDQLMILVKLDKDEQLHEVDMAIFTRKNAECLFKVGEISKSKITYVGNVGISLAECLSTPITKNNFFCILELIAKFSQELNKNRLSIARIILDMNYVYYNEQATTIQFIYLPLVQTTPGTNMLQFVRSFVAAAVPAQGPDMNFVARTMGVLGTMSSYDPNQLEQLVMRECGEVVRKIKGSNAAPNMVNVPQGGIPAGGAPIQNIPQAKPPMGIIPSGTARPNENPEEMTMKFSALNAGMHGMQTGRVKQMQPSMQTGGMNQMQPSMQTGGVNQMQASMQTGGVNQMQASMQTGGMNRMQASMQTGGMNRMQANVQTGGMNQQNDYSQQMSANQPEAYNPDVDDETGLLPGNARYMPEQSSQVDFPKLKRVSTNEIIQIDRPVFRVGKEKATVDYYVDNNGAVSRNHADIVVRGNQYYVIDLNSKNRTFINGRVIPIRQETVLYDGDRLKLANEEFIFMGS